MRGEGPWCLYDESSKRSKKLFRQFKKYLFSGGDFLITSYQGSNLLVRWWWGYHGSLQETINGGGRFLIALSQESNLLVRG